MPTRPPGALAALGAGTACLEVCRELGAQQGNFWTSMQQHLGRRPPGSVSAGGYSQELLLRRVNTGARWPAQEQTATGSELTMVRSAFRLGKWKQDQSKPHDVLVELLSVAAKHTAFQPLNASEL
ncbi:TPA: hypothetical protein ACH3X1_015742 [Trebouxia sp. C0004]